MTFCKLKRLERNIHPSPNKVHPVSRQQYEALEFDNNDKD